MWSSRTEVIAVTADPIGCASYALVAQHRDRVDLFDP
jgi:hypothetical protein